MIGDITFNVTTQPTATSVATTALKKPTTKSLPKVKSRMDNNNFSFEFGKAKVKAVSVRISREERLKRIQKQNAKTTTETATATKLPTPANELGMEKAATVVSASKPTPTPAPAPPSSSNKKAKAPTNDLILNVTVGNATTTTTTAAAAAKSKLTRAERLSKKRVERFGNKPQLGLTKDELKKELRRKHVNPNQLPRPGDLFKQQMDKERAEKRAAATANSTETTATTPTTESTTDPKPKPKHINRFAGKTPKMNLFDQSKNDSQKQLGQRAVKPIKETIFSNAKLSTLGLHEHAVKNLSDLLSITQLTTVQQKVIPQVLADRDVLVRSQTGSGKTLAYALPIIDKLQAVRPKIQRQDGVLALIIVPTRELATQTYELFQKLVKPYTWIVPGALIGGESRKSEKARLRKGINVLLGTPGRLVDHLLHTTSFRLGQLRFLVLDEADRLLELGYERDVRQIVEAIEDHRKEAQKQSQSQTQTTPEQTPTTTPTTTPTQMQLQRLLLSATLTSAVEQLAGLTLQNPLYIDNSDEVAKVAIKGTNGYTKESIQALQDDVAVAVDDDDDGLGEYVEDVTGVLTIPENLQLSYIVVPPKLRLVTLSALFAKERSANPKSFKAIVFMSTTEMVDFHHDLLTETLTQCILDDEDEKQHKSDDDDDDGNVLLPGLRFFKLHGSMTHAERQGVFKGFRDCSCGVLLATDVVGRGIDMPDVSLVVQYSPPQKTADFVHRVGRTARAGRRGRAVLFLAPSETQFVRRLEDKRIRIQQVDMYIYLQSLIATDDDAKTAEEAASNLQYRFQETLADDRELHDKSCKAFVSWMKFYTTFPKELKSIFNVKSAHMGHFAKSFALKEAPTAFAKNHSIPKPPPPTNRLTYTERDPEKMKQEKRDRRQQQQQQQQHNRLSNNARNRQSDLQSPVNKDSGAGAGVGTVAQGLGGVSRSKFLKSVNASRVLNISEFDSGLPEVKRRKM